MAKNLTISEFMTTNVAHVDADEKILAIAKKMRRKNISCVMVLEKKAETSQENISPGIPIGIITERNIIHFIADNAGHGLDHVTAKAIVPSTLISIDQSHSLFEAMVLFRSQRVKQLAVLDSEKRLTGIITYSDLIDAYYNQIELQSELGGNNCIDDDSPINTHLLELSLTDPMLKIGNRRSMEIDLKQTYELALRYRRPYSIALIDIDYFKKYNDNYGHQSGDTALIETCNVINNATRGSDRLYRYGGEEFLLLMPETNAEEAKKAIQRLNICVSDSAITHEYSPFGKITVSIGAYSFSPEKEMDSSDSRELYFNEIEKNCRQCIAYADDALYAAKSDGRNKTFSVAA